MPLALAAAAIVVPAATAAHASAAAPGVISGRLAGGLPSAGHGSASVRAYSVRSGVLVKVATAQRSGRFRVSLPAGAYVLEATAVRDRGQRSSRLVPVTLRAGQRRSGIVVRLRGVPARTSPALVVPAPSPAAPAAGEGGRTTYRLAPLTGSTAAVAALADRVGALASADMLGAETCPTKQTAGAAILPTLRSTSRLRRSPYVSRQVRITRALVDPQVAIVGHFTSKDSARAAFTIRLVELRTGRVLDELQGSVRRTGAGALRDERRIAAALAERICRTPPSYRVTLALSARGEYTAYNATGRIDSTITARTTSGEPYAAWTGNGQFTWLDNVFRSRVDPCPVKSVTPGSGGWAAGITRTSADTIGVALELTASEYTAYSKATFSCLELATIKDAPGAILTGTAPRTFTLPVSGGVGTISSTTTVPTGGFIQQGSLTVVPAWRRGVPGA